MTLTRLHKEDYRDRDSYLARYGALLTKALHLLDHGFTARLERISPDIARQISATKSEAARHALAYGRFEEMILDTYSLIPNIQKVVRKAYDQYGWSRESSPNLMTYTNSASNLFHTYLTTRDRDLKAITLDDVDGFKKEVKTLSVETASRGYIKLLFERIYNEDNLFIKIFDIEPLWNKSPTSAFQAIQKVSTTMVHPGNINPLATNLKIVLQSEKLQTVCNIVGWVANEYSVAEADEEESPFTHKCREYAARLLVEHLWPFIDSAFEADIINSITKGAAPDAALKMAPAKDGVASSNAHPLVKRALELLIMFDQAMPKERSVGSPIIFVYD